MEQYHVVVRGNDWRNNTTSYIATRGSGPTPIGIYTERNKQRGDKFLTHVSNLEEYGIDVDVLIGDGRGNKLFACKCLSQKDPKKAKNDSSKELLLNGKVANQIVNFLNGIGIKGKYIKVSKKKGI